MAKFVLVAGGAGFVGSNLCRRLLDAGDAVLCVDNLLTGEMENIAELIGNPGFRFIRHDIIKPLRVEGRVDEIYNLACPASPPRYQKDPIHTFRTCVDGTLNLLALAEAKGCLLYTSPSPRDRTRSRMPSSA